MNNLSDMFEEHKKNIVAFIDGVRKSAYQQGRADGIKDFADFISDYFDDPKLYCKPDKLIRMYKEYRGEQNE